MKKLRILLLFADYEQNKTLSYQQEWPKHFLNHSLFHCTAVNTVQGGLYANFSSWLQVKFRRFDAAVLLHSIYSNACNLNSRQLNDLAELDIPKVFLIGNEYKLMPEKLEFCRRLDLSLLITQCNSPEIIGLYKQLLGCEIMSLPNTGVDPAVFFPKVPFAERKIYIGLRGFRQPYYLGHNERELIAEYFRRIAPEKGLTVDISLDPKDRFDAEGWAGFLNDCKAQLGTEAGGDYFDPGDEIRRAVNLYIAQEPDASMEKIYDLFFKDRKMVPVRIISGRNIEAAATKTVQILFEGRYSDYLKPDVHYIALKKDFSNIDEILGKFRDTAYCTRITDNAYELTLREFTYENLIGKLYEKLISIS